MVKKFSNAVKGIYKWDFVRVGGHFTFSPPVRSIVQTDGSFSFYRGSCAAIVKSADGNTIWKKKWNLGPIENATEAEWASVLNGLRFALEHNQEVICIENDNLGVIHGLITPGYVPRNRYAQFYKKQIHDVSNQIAWVGVRWIPREENGADRLLR
jgi:ribonuclease HI